MSKGVYLGRTRFNTKTGVYLPIIVAENMNLQDGDLVEFYSESENIVIRKTVKNVPFEKINNGR